MEINGWTMLNSNNQDSELNILLFRTICHFGWEISIWSKMVEWTFVSFLLIRRTIFNNLLQLSLGPRTVIGSPWLCYIYMVLLYHFVWIKNCFFRKRLIIHSQMMTLKRAEEFITFDWHLNWWKDKGFVDIKVDIS